MVKSLPRTVIPWVSVARGFGRVGPCRKPVRFMGKPVANEIADVSTKPDQSISALAQVDAERPQNPDLG